MGKPSAEPVTQKSSGTAATHESKQDREVLQEFSIKRTWDSRPSTKFSLFQKVHTVKLGRSKVTLFRVFAMLAFFISLLGIRKCVKL